MKNIQVINKQYDKIIRLGVSALIIAALAPILYSYKGGVRDISFKHFDQELGYSCVYIRNMGMSDFKCNKITPVSSTTINPVDKKWVYSMDNGGKIEVIRKVRGDKISIELKHPYIHEETIKTLSINDEYS